MDIVKKINELDNNLVMRLDNGCLIWKGHYSYQGYPIYYHNKKALQVKRVVWDASHDEEPSECNIIKMACRNVSCVEVKHMILSNQGKGGRHKGKRSTQKYNWEHIFNEETTFIVKGKDYDCTTLSMLAAIRKEAKARNIPITLANNDTSIVIRRLKECSLESTQEHQEE